MKLHWRSNSLSSRGKVIVLLVVVAFIGATFLLSDVKVELTDESFTVRGFLCGQKETRYDDINVIEYRESFEAGSRSIGSETLKVRGGTFQNQEFGRYSLYEYKGVDAYIVIYGMDESVLVFNQPSEEETKEVYDQIFSRWESIRAAAMLTEG